MTIYTADRVIRSLVHTVGFRAGSQIATVLSYIVLVRGTTTQDFGVYNLLQAVIPIISTTLSLGIEQTLRRFQPEYLKNGNAAAAAWLHRVAARTRLVTNASLLLIILAAWGWVAPLFKLTGYRVDFAIFGVMVLIHFQSRILQFSLASHMLHQYSVGATAVMSFAKLVAYSAMWASGALSLRTAILCDIGAYGAAMATMYWGYRRHCIARDPGPWKPDAAERSRLKRYAIFNNFNDAGSVFSYSQIDNFFVAGFINPAAVATYGFFTRLREMIGQIIPVRLFENIIQPMFFAVSKDQADDRVPKYFTFLANTSFVVLVPMVAFVAVYHREFIEIVAGGRYTEDSALFAMMLAFSLAQIMSTPITLVAQFEERASLILGSQAFALYLIAAMAVLVPRYGIYGAALSASSMHLFRNYYVWWRVRARARWIDAGRSIGAMILIWVPIAGACYALRELMHGPPLLVMLPGVLLCVIGVLVHLRSPALCASDRELLSDSVGRRAGKLVRILGLQPRSNAAAS